MRTRKLLSGISIAATLLATACSVDRYPESEFADTAFWNTENDLIYATNRLYQELDAPWIDNRGDDVVNQGGPNGISSGNRVVPNTSGDWNDRYDEIFTANNILEKAVKAAVPDNIKNRYLAEARFFRAYAYLNLVQKYGDVPLVLKTLDFNSPELYMGRTPRAEVLTAIYEDLDFAAEWLPSRTAIPAAQYGRISRSTAWALKARAGLYEGSFRKFHGLSDWQQHLQTAIDAAKLVMEAGHTLYPNYGNLFQHVAEGPANSENLLVKIFGVDNANLLLGHNNSRDLENGRMAPTRNLLRQYLYADGLPAFNVDNTPSATQSALFVAENEESSYNTILENRDPRMLHTLFMAGEAAYKGPWVPTTSLGSRSGFAPKKGFSTVDQTINGAGTVDKILIRYGEVLLIYAEATYELNDAISDADLDLSINKLRDRVGFAVKLSNAFVTTNGLSMRDEIRRERTVELALEGFRFDDLIRWKMAEQLLPQELLGAKYIETDWPGTNQSNLNLNQNQIIIVETDETRNFQPNRDYLYPVPINEINLSGGSVVQNPNWQ